MNAKEFELAIESALGEYGCSDRNPCGGTGYVDGEPVARYRVLFCDGAECEYFATAELAIAAAKSYREKMVAELASEHEEDCFEDEGEAAYGREE